MADTIARAMAAQAKALAVGTTNGETVDARTGADTVARATLGAFVREMHQQVIDATSNTVASIAATLVHGLNVITAGKPAVLPLTVGGRTLVNLFGNDGNFEKDTVTDGVADGWIKSGGADGYLSLDTTNFKYGSKGQRIASLAADASTNRYVTKSSSALFITFYGSKYYVCLVDVITDGTSTGKLALQYGTGFSVFSQTTTSKTIYVKFNPSSDFTTGYATLQNINAIGVVGWVSFDGARIYEISAAEYAKIDVDPEYTGDKLADKFPYVDGVKHVSGPMVTKQGKNLVGPFTSWDVMHANATVNSPYDMTLNGTATFLQCYIDFPVLGGQSYTFSSNALPSGARLNWATYDSNGGNVDLLTNALQNGTSTRTVTTSAAAKKMRIILDNNATGTFTFTNIQLELGSAATAFEPQNIDYLYAPVTLASSVDGTVKDSLFYRDGAWRKGKRWITDVVLDGALAWTFTTDYTGYKRFHISRSAVPTASSLGVQNISGAIMPIKYNGAPLKKFSTSIEADSADYNTSDNFVISAFDTDTGFAETYAPIASDIQAFMNGWKISDNAFGPYSTGTKYWTALELQKSDFAGKVTGSTVENAHIIKRTAGGAGGGSSTLLIPSAVPIELNQVDYDSASKLEGAYHNLSTPTVGAMSEILFSFSLIEHVLRKYGTAIFGAAVTTVDRVAWLKANVGKFYFNWFGFGSSPTGNKASVQIWRADTSAWFSPTSHTNATVTKLISGTTSLTNYIDANGFIHFLAYADAAGPIANPTAAPTLSASGTGSGLAAGAYFAMYSWQGTTGETLASPEASITITAGQNITVTVPTFPSTVPRANIYIGTTSGTETLQNNITGTGYTQAAPLEEFGAPLPGSNTAIGASTINTDFAELEVNLLVQTLPAGYAYKAFTPYRLSYQLATTAEELVPAEGAINLQVGGNQLDVQEGVIVREKVVPAYTGSGPNTYAINHLQFSGGLLKNRAEKIIAIYKNGVADKKWFYAVDSFTNGKIRASINAADYDATAEYSVTYTLLDKYAKTAANTDVTGTYENGIATTLNHTVRRLADVETNATINANAIAELYRRMKALGG